MCRNQKKVIYCSPGFGPVFGEAADIAISSNCNNNELSYSKMGKSYYF